MTKDEMKSTIVSYLQTGAKGSASNIAKIGLNMSKANDNVKKILKSLVRSKDIKIDKSGRYDEYFMDTTAVSKSSGSKKAGLKTETVSGFSINKIKSGFAIGCPDGQKQQIKKNEYLLVINNAPEYKCQTPADVIEGIRDYTTRKHITAFNVKDSRTGKQVSGTNDVDMTEHLMFFNITKVNKAG